MRIALPASRLGVDVTWLNARRADRRAAPVVELRDSRARLLRAAVGAYVVAFLALTACARHLDISRDPPSDPVAQEHDYIRAVRAQIVRDLGYPCVLNATSGTCEYKDARVVLDFVIHKDGRLGYVKMLKSSGYSTYDEHAIATVKRSAPFPPVPDSLSLMDVPIHLNLNYVTRQPQPPATQ